METVKHRECAVVSFNIFSDLPRFHRLDRRLELIAAAVAAERPHVIGLQEPIRYKLCGDTGQKLLTLTNQRCEGEPYKLVYAPADGAGEGDWAFDQGIALMSRLVETSAPKVLKYRSQVELRADVGGQSYRLPDDRIAMHARYEFDRGLELDVYTTHLTDASPLHGGNMIRLRQAHELIEWIGASSASGNSVIVTGDFNDAPESETMKLFAAASFLDAHALAGTGAGYTNCSDDLDLTSPVGDANQRIDYVLFRPGRLRDPEIVEARLFLDQPAREPDGQWLRASDHFGVLARFRF